MVDLYFQGPLRPGHFSLMDVTYTDTQFDPFHKIRSGWMKPRTVTQSGTYELVAGSGDALKIQRPNRGPPEYFLLENRQHGKYDTKLPDTGLAICRFIENETTANWVEKHIHFIRSPLAQAGDVKALWHAPDAAVPTLNWADGTFSGIKLTISESAETMTVAVEMP